MYTVFEPSPAQAGTSDIIMANTSSSICSISNSGSTLVSTNSTNNLPYYQRPLTSSIQSVHSMHATAGNIHTSDDLQPPPISLSPPLHMKNTSSVNTDIVIKSSSSPRMLPPESIPRDEESESFTSSSCLYNLDSIPSGISSPSRADHLLRTSNSYLQNCGSEVQTTQNMDINPTSEILMPSEYGNHYNSNSNRTQSIQDQSSQYHRFSTLEANTNPLDLQDHQKRINNNNNLVTGYNLGPPNSTVTAFTTPSPSSDSHSESPTTPKIHSLSTGTKETPLLCTINGGSQRQFDRGNERVIVSPSSVTPYHLVGSPGTNTNYNVLDIGLAKNHIGSSTHSKVSHGKNGNNLENGSSTSLTPPNSATHLRKECAASYGNIQLGHLQGLSSNDDIMLDVSTGSASATEAFSAYGSEPLESNLGKRMSYASSNNITGASTTANSNLYSKASSSSVSPPPSSGGLRGGTGMQRDGHFMFSQEQIDCISDSLQQRRDYRKLDCFLQEYSTSNDNQSGASSSTNNCKNANGNSESVVRGMAAVAYENGNYRDLYQIIESRDFDPAHHEELQRIWYEAHYKEAEGIRGRPLGKRFHIISIESVIL